MKGLMLFGSKLPTNRLTDFLKSVINYFDLNKRCPKNTYYIELSDSDANFLEDKCSHMIVSPEKFIENLVAIHVRPETSGFRLITRRGILINSEGKSINEYFKEQFK